ncbi:uncharacterized protein LOC114282007 [Camellia sinensis]|uniref:uncharacterized protein LOC114282007 n=1 Tax=Camellia sinensis TaxID=4442 RepID=UPI001035AF85|nr:uncharacterized protein LOC114282007 [Camellia sinensis]
MIITRDDTVGISSLKQFLHRQFEMKDLGALSYFIGLEISQDSSGYFFTQAKYASDLLARTSLTDYKTVTTPIDPQTRFTPLDGPLLLDATLYRQLVGSLVYLTVTRPDIACAVHIVNQFMTAPCSPHYATLVRILRYLKGTLFHGLHYSPHSSLQLHAFSDVDWAGDPTDRRSTTGFCFFLGLSKASKGILEKDINSSKQLSKSIRGKEGLSLEEELSQISSKESAKTNGLVSPLAIGEVEGRSKRLASLASKMSTSSVDMKRAERALVEGTKDCIEIGEMGGASSAVSMVLATNKSREEGLELGKSNKLRVGEPPALSLGESATIKEKVIAGASLGGEGKARLERELN